MSGDTIPITQFLSKADEITDLEDWGVLEEATGPEMTNLGVDAVERRRTRRSAVLGMHPRPLPLASRNP